MIELRWHGRGGQGAVTASELLAKAAISSGLYAQAFPFFGPERRGAPVLAFTRIDQEPIDICSQIYEPDVVVVLDPTLQRAVKITDGLKPDGMLIINSSKSCEELKKMFEGYRLAAVDASSIAMQKIGVNITNSAMLGAVVKATGIVDLKSVEHAVLDRFNEANVEAVRETFSRTVVM